LETALDMTEPELNEWIDAANDLLEREEAAMKG
jgi:hypothetical protein